MYDILIPAAEKDFIKLRFSYDSIIKNLNGFDKIHCITNEKVPRHLLISGVEYYLDKDVVDFDFSLFSGKVRAGRGWYIQQFIKLFQQVTADDYLEVESDIVFNRPIDIIRNGKPTFLFGRDQHHLPYFRFMKEMLGLEKVYKHSFINETMYFKREIIKHMVSSTGLTKYGFFAKAVRILNEINETSGLAEYELYGNYATKYFKDTYNYKNIRTFVGGKRGRWTKEEIKRHINFYKDKDYDMVGLHTWGGV